MNDYLNKNEDYIDTVLDLELTRLRNKLPNVIVTPDRTSVKSDLQGEQSRYELWDSFKSINDKVFMDICRCRKRVDLFDLYYDKFGVVCHPNILFQSRNKL